MSALDRYDPNQLDDEEYSDISQGDRLAAETAMKKRDRAAGINRDDKNYLYGKTKLKLESKFKCFYYDLFC